ncbi:acetyltransferase (GNAT) family protein [Isoptericola sp. CG 20/1183]|uniref:Acetyltransferase (GNAT) family protein n=1 Tax=Isoptericola halotolerans TaxID=300560 RepID=A0ABX5ECN0_9MICO|nr:MULTISPECIES: GNAT family N-acetyltransferase [Isoptericola]PRZ03241.1 acetyltransferase (GNAT) family protein [Isoptericola sp. CG 20/1183]PRZ03547.1 acetyltransferase (GNAT) family protein [Isoptericola halotolerans]
MGELVIRPADEVPFDDLQAVLGSSAAGRCQCQRQVLGDAVWWHMPVEERRMRLAEQTSDPESSTTSGLVAFEDGEPIGWVAVAPRPTYRRYYGRSPVVWSGRQEDRDDPTVWAVACFVVRAGHRGQGLTYELARAAVDFARSRDATALEGYPILAPGGGEIVWDEASVGTPQVFAAAGMEQVTAPTVRRRVMRIDW